MSSSKIINIGKQFSRTPGARYRSDGDHSGEQFREEILEPAFLALLPSETITIELDGTSGYATSFLEESFGGLARLHGVEAVFKTLKFISEEEPFLLEEIESYISESKNGGR